MQEASRIANRNGTNISIKVKVTETGCFQISIQAIQSLSGQCNEPADRTAGFRTVYLLTILGFIGLQEDLFSAH